MHAATSPLTAVLVRAALPILGTAAVGALLGGTRSALVGALAAAAMGFVYHVWKLAQLAAWLEGERRVESIPRGFGVWEETVAALYRLLKTQDADGAALAQLLERFRQAIVALPDGAMMLDRSHNLIWCNPEAERQWHLSLEADRLQAITHFIRQPEFVAYLGERQFATPLVLRVVRREQADVAAERTYALQPIPFGEDQWLLLSRDISERERLDRMRSDFVANVSHEMRTPLTVVAGFIETLQTNVALPADARAKALDHMAAQTARMQRLVEDLLTLSRLEDVRNKLVEAPVNMQALVDAAAEDARHLSAGRQRIETVVAPAWLRGNRDELASAVGNLVANAVRYTPTEGRIRLSLAFDAAGDLVFAVRDDGEGIAAEHLPRLTERFYRVDRGRSRDAGGTGLGLAIVKHVALRHGARLDIESAQHGDDRGSTFRLVFPAARSAHEAAPIALPPVDASPSDRQERSAKMPT